MLHFFAGAIMIFVGFMIVAKSEWLLNNFGSIAFFERYLGTEGGSRLGYKLAGLLVIFIGFMVMTGLITGFLTWALSPITRYNRP